MPWDHTLGVHSGQNYSSPHCMNHILLVEGSRETALHLSRLIARHLDAELYQAGSASEAFELVQRKPIDLVVVDVRLPQINGFDICTKLQEQESSQHLPVLLLTSLEGEFSPEVKALSMGRGEIYTLPTPGSSLVAWIKILLSIVSARESHFQAAKSPGMESDLCRLFLEHVNEALLWLEVPSGKILVASAGVETVTGYPVEALKGKTIWDLTPEEHHERIRTMWGEAGGGVEKAADVPIVRRTGTQASIRISLQAQPLGAQDGIIVRLSETSESPVSAGSVHLTGSLGNLDVFFSTLGHEVRNPLTGISTNVQFMQMAFADTDTQREIYGDILSAVNRLDLMFREIVEFLRPIELRHLSTNLNQLLEDALSLHEELIRGRKRINVIKQLDSSLPHVEVDPVRFLRAVSALVEHCAYEGHEDGRITIASQVDADAIRLSVSHDGQHLNAQRMKHVFDPLTALKSPESGLGLAMAKRIFDAHGCELEIESEPGRGTRFTATLPLRLKSSTSV